MPTPDTHPTPFVFFVGVWQGDCTQHTLILGCGIGSSRAPPQAVFVVWGRERFIASPGTEHASITVIFTRPKDV